MVKKLFWWIELKYIKDIIKRTLLIVFGCKQQGEHMDSGVTLAV